MVFDVTEKFSLQSNLQRDFPKIFLQSLNITIHELLPNLTSQKLATHENFMTFKFTTHLFAWWINWILLLDLDELQCGSIVRRMECTGCRIIARICRESFVECVILSGFIGWWQNFRCWRGAFVDHQSRVCCAVIQHCIGCPHWAVVCTIQNRLSSVIRNRSVWEAMECEILVCQEGHRCDTRNLEGENEQRMKSDCITKPHHQQFHVSRNFKAITGRLWETCTD